MVEGISLPSAEALTIDPSRVMTSIARIYSTMAQGEIGPIRIPEVRSIQRQPIAGSDQVMAANHRSKTSKSPGCARGWSPARSSAR
jgi:hypothetical protein